jgi:hypothetical protein
MAQTVLLCIIEKGLIHNENPSRATALARLVRRLHQTWTARARAALADLPPGQANAVWLTAFYGHTAQQVAVSEDIPLGTAKTRIRQGLRTRFAVLGHVERLPQPQRDALKSKFRGAEHGPWHTPSTMTTKASSRSAPPR